MARNGAGGNREAVSHVDDRGHHREVDDFLLAELLSRLIVDIVRHMRLGDIGDGLGPCQRGSFAIGIERSFAPGVQLVKALFGFAKGSSMQ